MAEKAQAQDRNVDKTGLTVFTFWSVEPGVAGAGIVPDGLHTLPLLAAGRVLAGGCRDRGSECGEKRDPCSRPQPLG